MFTMIACFGDFVMFIFVGVTSVIVGSWVSA